MKRKRKRKTRKKRKGNLSRQPIFPLRGESRGLKCFPNLCLTQTLRVSSAAELVEETGTTGVQTALARYEPKTVFHLHSLVLVPEIPAIGNPLEICLPLDLFLNEKILVFLVFVCTRDGLNLRR